jgi:hypothetical protein
MKENKSRQGGKAPPLGGEKKSIVKHARSNDFQRELTKIGIPQALFFG